MNIVGADARAEREIKGAAEWKRTALDLSCRHGDSEPDDQLTEIPRTVWDLQQLQTLRLASNRLSTISEAVAQLEQLRVLDASKNKLFSLPVSLGTLSKLESLDLSSNRLGGFAVKGCNSLKSLNMSANLLTDVPVEIADLASLQELDLSNNRLTTLPDWIGNLTQLRELRIANNKITVLPESMANLSNLELLDVGQNRVQRFPDTLCRGVSSLRILNLAGNALTELPPSVGLLQGLTTLNVRDNDLGSLPASISNIPSLNELSLWGNNFEPELQAASMESFQAVISYLRAKTDAQVRLWEAKLILVGEGEVGKSCLLGALRGDEWEDDRTTTHGVEIKPVELYSESAGSMITLNGWDFGGQPVYRPTHQLFFSAPAVYVVVWKPREGPQQGLVADWINLIKYREPEAKVLVVATHGGPKARQPDIDRQGLWDKFGKDMIVDFHFVNSKPDSATGERTGIAALKAAIAATAAVLPEMGREVPKRWEDIRRALFEISQPYLSFTDVVDVCRSHGMSRDEASNFLRVLHRLGHIIHYQHDPALSGIVILKPDWLATAISLVLDDDISRQNKGFVEFARLKELWDDPRRPATQRYASELHPLFLRLMERFDLSYKAAIPSEADNAITFWHRIGQMFTARHYEASELQYTSLVAQLVSDVRPESKSLLGPPRSGEQTQTQLCRIVDAKDGRPASAEGLFFQLIVRLHKFSLGRSDYRSSVHWRHGLLLEDEYGARALLEHILNDVKITVQSPYPERFLAALTYEVKWLVGNLWAGIRCEIMVPCIASSACLGLFDVRQLLENKRRGHPEQPCPECNEWQQVDQLLRNAPAASKDPLDELLTSSAETVRLLNHVRRKLDSSTSEIFSRFDVLDTYSRELISKVDAAYMGVMKTLLDEGRDGPRLFSINPVHPGFLDRPSWAIAKFKVVLWCEHSRLPIHMLPGRSSKHGVYTLLIPRDWLARAAPFLKALTGMLTLVVPVSAAAAKFIIDDKVYQGISRHLELSEKCASAIIAQLNNYQGSSEENGLELTDTNGAIRAGGPVLREFQVWLAAEDKGFGGLIRVQNKRHEFLWIDPQFAEEY